MVQTQADLEQLRAERDRAYAALLSAAEDVKDAPTPERRSAARNAEAKYETLRARFRELRLRIGPNPYAGRTLPRRVA